MEPLDISDEDWAALSPLLPAEHGRHARPSRDNRAYLCGMIWVLRTGRAWRELPPRYGKWNSVYVRFLRWSNAGLWDLLLPRLVARGLTGDWPAPPPGRPQTGRAGRSRRDGGYLRNRLLAEARRLRPKGA